MEGDRTTTAPDPAVRAVGQLAPPRSLVLVDHPGPWPADLRELPELAPLHAAVDRAGDAGRPWLVVCVAPASARSLRHVVVHERPAGPFDRYRRRDDIAGPDEAVALAAAMVDGTVPGTVRLDRAELLVDAARPAADDLWAALDGAVPALGDGLRVRRASPFTTDGGGTEPPAELVHLPSGASWAGLAPAEALAVLTRAGHPAELAGRFLGSPATAGPAERALEREVLAAVGWPYLDHWRRTAARPGPEGAVHVELEHRATDGEAWRWTALVDPAGALDPATLTRQPAP